MWRILSVILWPLYSFIYETRCLWRSNHPWASFFARKSQDSSQDDVFTLQCPNKHNATQKYLPMPSHWEVEKSKRLPGDVFDAAIRARSLKVAASGSKAVGHRHNTLGARSGLWKTWLETWDEINFSASIYRTWVRSLGMLVSDSVTHWLTP